LRGAKLFAAGDAVIDVHGLDEVLHVLCARRGVVGAEALRRHHEQWRDVVRLHRLEKHRERDAIVRGSVGIFEVEVRLCHRAARIAQCRHAERVERAEKRRPLRHVERVVDDIGAKHRRVNVLAHIAGIDGEIVVGGTSRSQGDAEEKRAHREGAGDETGGHRDWG
jgi:hypothetical protein